MRNYFYGWYLKCQSDTQTLAIIPAIHRREKTNICSIQIITDKGAWSAEFPGNAFHRQGKMICIEKNRFGEEGIHLSLNTPGLSLEGKLEFGPLLPLKYDIMGPFARLPFLECRHSVWSICHTVSGRIYLNGEDYCFREARGYWEGDSGRSFPKEYFWTQCCLPQGAVMLSAAEVSLASLHFTGIVGVVLWEGKEYRIATYLGAALKQLQPERIHIVQGSLELELELKEELKGEALCSLKAPADGAMARTIHESVACRVFYRFRKSGRTIFSHESDRASVEYEYKKEG